MVAIFSSAYKGMVCSPVCTALFFYMFTVFITNNITTACAYSATNKSTAYSVAN